MFIPYNHQAGVGHIIIEPQPSPTLHPAARLATHYPQTQTSVQLGHGSETLLDTDIEEELQEELQLLNFKSNSESQSSSQSHLTPCSHSGSQASTDGEPQKAVKPHAQDVWRFFTKIKEEWHECIPCQ